VALKGNRLSVQAGVGHRESLLDLKPQDLLQVLPPEAMGLRNILVPGISLGLAAFILSFAMNASLQKVTENISIYFAVPLFLLVVGLGVITDALGLASAKANERAILSMASRKVKGAKESLWFVRNAPKMSSVFNDLMGDVSATVSGALAVAIVYKIKGVLPEASLLLLTSAGVALASFLTCGGKAVIKPFSLRRAENIVLLLGRTRKLMLRLTGRQ